jgi:hypothetical protein
MAQPDVVASVDLLGIDPTRAPNTPVHQPSPAAADEYGITSGPTRATPRPSAPAMQRDER